MDYRYLITPFISWLCAGVLKFIINSIRGKKWAFHHIGYGGLPSNHSAIVSSTGAMIALQEGVQHPAFAVAITLAFIVILDASSLRRQVGRHAVAINSIVEHHSIKNSNPKLRERIGHTPIEIFSGVGVGISTAWIINWFYSRLF